jgi:glycosyltransferase involved in cell wall biosynthesis
MHILLIHQAFAAIDEPGGTRHHELARYLVQAGHQVTIVAGRVSYLTDRPAAAGREIDGMRIVRPASYASWHQSFVRRTLSFFSFMLSSFIAGLAAGKVDLVWGTSPPLFQVVSAWLVARLKQARFVFEVRDLWPHFAIEVGVLRNDLLIRLSRWLEAFLYRRADLVVINSPGFRQHVTERGAGKVELVPNGVDVDMFVAGDDGQAFRRQHGLEEAFLVVYTGAHGLSNDLDTALDAAAALGSDATLVLIGAGKEKPALQAQAEAMGLANVRFLPPVPKQEMPGVLAAADACLAILKPLDAYKTTYPNKVFDYMAAGKPVLLAIDGVIRQVVETAQAGIFVPPGDSGALAAAVRRLRQDRQSATAMGQRGRQYVREHFDRPKQAELLGTLFVRMLETPDGDGR